MEGWIKLHRKIRDHWIWNDANKLKWWLDILLEVNHSGKSVAIGYKVFECKKGECLVSLQSWGKRWGVTKTVVNNFFKMLENDNMIETVNETVTTRLIVCNYESYQEFQNANETQTKRKQNATVPQQSTTKNDKNDKNKSEVKEEKKEELIFPPLFSQKFVDSWLDLMKMAKWAKKPQHSLQLTLKSLGKYDEEFAIELVERAIEGNWQGVIFSNTANDFEKWKQKKGGQNGRDQQISDSAARKLQYAEAIARFAIEQK